MTDIVHNKLVRDKIPAIIIADNATPVTRQLDTNEYRQELFKKLLEEAKELLEADGSLDERADVAEVLTALDELLGFNAEDIERARAKKVEKRGGFQERIFLEKVIDTPKNN